MFEFFVGLAGFDRGIRSTSIEQHAQLFIAEQILSGMIADPWY